MDERDVTGTTPQGRPPHVARRLHHAIGPIAAGLIIDAIDLVTFGPYGLYTGFLVGGVAGFWLASLFRFTVPFRLFWACVAGLYCTAPMTEPFPIATMIGAVHRFFHWTAE